jgi:tripartite-type tricarboxylate transporter receptor subunit TctC
MDMEAVGRRMKSFSGVSRREATLALLAAALPLGTARGNDYPSHPIKMIVPVPPGSGVDAVSRSLGAQMSEAIGVPIVTDYRPGAGAIVGSDALAKSPPDGYTIMMGYTAHSTNPLFNASLPYDTLRDFTAVIYVCYVPAVLMVHPSTSANSVQELVDMMKKNPGNYTFASGGAGATAHLCGELLKHLTGVDMQHVPYKGNAPALNDLLGGHVTMMFDIASTALPQVKSGKLKGLAVTSAKRSPDAPELPTMIEAGFPGFEVVAWYMLLAPANLPKEVLARLNSEADKALKTAGVRSTLAGLGFEIAGGTPEQADVFLRSEMKKWAEVVAATGIKAQ